MPTSTRATADDRDDTNKDFDTLVIGSGGARGYLALGTVMGLLDSGYLRRTHTYVGTSVGSLVAAALAAELDLRDVLAALGATAFNPDFDLGTLESGWGLDGSSLREFLDTLLAPLEGVTFGALHERTRKKLVVCCTNVTDSRAEYFSADTAPEVPVLDALCASCSVPMIFTPVKIGGKLFVDGAVVDALPLGQGRGHTLGLTFSFTSPEQEFGSWVEFLTGVVGCAVTPQARAPGCKAVVVEIPADGVAFFPWNVPNMDAVVLRGYRFAQRYAKKLE